MFEIDKIRSLNELEMKVFNFIQNHQNEMASMKVKDIANNIPVSIAMVTRVAKKLGYSGYSELRAAIVYQNQHNNGTREDNLKTLLDYFHSINSTYEQKRIEPVIELIVNARNVLIFGTGVSGACAVYADRLWNRMGVRTRLMDDLFMRVRGVYNNLDAAVLFTVMGETSETISQILYLKNERVPVVVVSSTENNTSSKLADYSLSYYLPNRRSIHNTNSVSHIPVFYLIESIATNIEGELNKKKETI